MRRRDPAASSARAAGESGIVYALSRRSVGGDRGRACAATACARWRTTPASTRRRVRASRTPSRRGRSTWWSRRSPSAWASTSPTSASSSTATCRARSRATTRRSGAPAATASPSTCVLFYSWADVIGVGPAPRRGATPRVGGAAAAAGPGRVPARRGAGLPARRARGALRRADRRVRRCVRSLHRGGARPRGRAQAAEPTPHASLFGSGCPRKSAPDALTRWRRPTSRRARVKRSRARAVSESALILLATFTARQIAQQIRMHYCMIIPRSRPCPPANASL